jgi:DNA-binding MarR family transcriptional regulator
MLRIRSKYHDGAMTDQRPKRFTLLYQLYLTSQASRRFMRQALDGTGISGEEYALLSYLYGNGPRTLTQAARDFGLAVTTVATMLAPLFDAGELERMPHPTDRRARLIGLTDTGRQRLEAAIPAFTSAYRVLLARLESPGGAEVEGLFAALDTLRMGILDTIETLDRGSVRSA